MLHCRSNVSTVTLTFVIYTFNGPSSNQPVLEMQLLSILCCFPIRKSSKSEKCHFYMTAVKCHFCFPFLVQTRTLSRPQCSPISLNHLLQKEKWPFFQQNIQLSHLTFDSCQILNDILCTKTHTTSKPKTFPNSCQCM